MELNCVCTILNVGLFLLFYLNVICSENPAPVRVEGECLINLALRSCMPTELAPQTYSTSSFV